MGTMLRFQRHGEEAKKVLRGVHAHWNSSNSAAIYSACSRIAYGMISKTADISPSWALYHLMDEIIRRKGAGLDKYQRSEGEHNGKHT